MYITIDIYGGNRRRSRLVNHAARQTRRDVKNHRVADQTSFRLNKILSHSDTTIYDVLVIGGGVSGLKVAIDVKSDNPTWNVCIIEREPVCGGRISTEYDDDTNVSYENGPWRLHPSHYKLIDLTKEYNLTLSRCTSSLENNNTFKKHISISGSELFESAASHVSDHDDDLKCVTASSVSAWDVDAFSTSVLQADENGRRTGYGRDFRTGARDTNTYRVPNSEKTGFLVVNEGYQELINRMQTHCISLGVRIYNRYGVADVNFDTSVHRYQVCTNYRSDNDFKKCMFVGRKVCLALPPHCITKWSIYKHLQLQSSQVSALPLIHVYARLDRDRILQLLKKVFHAKEDVKGFHIIHDGITQQLISSNYTESDWIQVAYTGGESAFSLERTRRCVGMYGLKKAIVKDLVNVFKKGAENTTANEEEIETAVQEMIDVDELKPCYYANAVHKWEPAFGLTPRLASWLATVAPHPLYLPNLVTAGEAWSLKQGWIEGALETAEAAALELCSSVDLIDRLEEMQTFPNQIMVYDGWVLDVSKWHEVHPGSSAAITKYASQNIKANPPADVQELFNHINHSQDAMRVLSALRVGIIGRNGEYLSLGTVS